MWIAQRICLNLFVLNKCECADPLLVDALNLKEFDFTKVKWCETGESIQQKCVSDAQLEFSKSEKSPCGCQKSCSQNYYTVEYNSFHKNLENKS